jgi:hypothetical protein
LASGPLSWIGSLFVCQPPICGFTSGEQRLLSAALDGKPDEAVLEAPGISIDGVKKTWRSVYGKASGCLPNVIPANSGGENGTSLGKEKKLLLLAYLREHPAELPPRRQKYPREK